MMDEILTEFGSHAWFWSMSIRSTIALGVTTIVALLFRRKSAALRHRIWVLGLAASILVPIASWAVPSLPLPVLSAKRVGEIQQKPDDTNSTSVPFGATNKLSTDSPNSGFQSKPVLPALDDTAVRLDRDAEPSSEPLISNQFLVKLWLAGLVLGVGTFVLIYTRQAWRVGRLSLLQDPCWQHAVETAAKRLGLRRKVTTVLADRACVPATFGVFRTRLIIPADWQSWPADQRECILLHELAHVYRWDVATQVFARLAVLVQWFNPLAWYAACQLRIERELASDDCVLQTGCPASDYAQHLLLTVKQYHPEALFAGVAMAHTSRLRDRVQAILDPQKDRNAVGRWTFIFATAVMLMGCVVIGAMTPSPAAVPGAGLPSDSVAPVWKKGHTYYYRKTLPTSLAFANDGKSLLSADATGELMSLNLTHEGNSYTWSAKVEGSHPVVAYSLDGKTVYATCDDGVVVLDNTGKAVGRIEKKNSKPIALGVFPVKPLTKEDSWTQVVFGNARGYFVETWVTGRGPGSGGGIETSNVLKDSEPTDAWAAPLAVDPRGRSAIMTGPIDRTGEVAGRAGANVLWAYVCGDYEDGSPGNRIMKGHATTVVSAAWSKEGSTAVTGDANGRVIEWNPTRLADDGKIGDIKEVRRHEFGGRVAALAISNNGKRMAAYVLGKQGRVYVWNAGESADNLLPIYTEPSDLTSKNAFASIAISADGQQLAACAGDRDWLQQPGELTGKVRLWNFAASPSQQPSPKLAYVNPHGNGRGPDFTIPNNNVIYATEAKKGNSIYLYGMEDGTILSASSFGDDVSICRLARSPERDWIVVGLARRDSDSTLFNARVQHANMHPPRKTIPDCKQLVGLGHGGNELAVVRDEKIEMWNTVTGELVARAPFSTKQIDASVFAPDGNLVIATENSLILWDWQSNKYDRIDIGRKTASLAISPDGRFLAEGPENGHVQVRDLVTRKVVRSFNMMQRLSVPHLAFTQSGRVLIACDNTDSANPGGNNISRPRIFLWDIADGSLAHQVSVPGVPQSFDISPNELYLVARVTGTAGSKLMGWRLDGQKIEPRRGNELPATASSP